MSLLSSKHAARVFAVTNQKGGVGKTTTAVNLAAALAAKERKTLLIDADSQANATSSVGVNEARAEDRNLYRLLAGEISPENSVLSTDLEYLDVIPGHRDLVGIEVEWVDKADREMQLKDKIAALLPHYEAVFIDCPPALSIMTINALTAADSVIIPLQSEYLAMEGLSHLMQTIEVIKNHFNPRLDIEGVLLTMHDNRNRLAREVAREVREHFGSQAFTTVIPRNVRLGEAPSFGKPVILYDIQCRGAERYLALADELLSRSYFQHESKPAQRYRGEAVI